MLKGWLFLDKPIRMTSYQLVAQVEKKVNYLINQSLKNEVVKVREKPKNQVRIGHIGTLDPMASGLMILALGKATRLVEYGMSKDKEYIFTITWGVDTDSHDQEGKIISQSNRRAKINEIEKIIIVFCH